MNFGGNMNPVPFIAGAYGLAIFLLAGYSVWMFQRRKKLRLLKAAVSGKGT